MVNLAGAFRGLGLGLTQVGTWQAEEAAKQRAAEILSRRQLAMEALKEQRADEREAGKSAEALKRQRDGEVLAQSLRELETLGIDPKSDAGRKYIQDRALDAQGPTATETARRGQDVSERNNKRTVQQSDTNNVRTTRTSRDNNRDDNATARRGQETTPVATVVSDRGDPTVVYKNGQTQPIRNGHLPGSADRRGGGRSQGGGAPSPPPMAPTRGAKVRDRTGNYTWVADGTRWHLES